MKNRSFTYILLVILLFITATLLLGDSSNTTSEEKSQADIAETSEKDTALFDALASLSFTDYAGNDQQLDAFRGTPLIINAWASWCPFCKDELPDFVTIQEEFGNAIAVIAINRKESLAVARAYTDQAGLTDKLAFWLDSRDTFYKTIGGFGMPETLFINGDGEVVVHKRGFMTLEEIRLHTEKIVTP